MKSTDFSSVKNIQYLGTNLTKYMKDLYSENYIKFLEECKWSPNRERYKVYASEESPLLWCQWSIDLMNLYM